MNDDDVLPVGWELFGYEIESVIGRGGFGVTYRARHARLHRAVAIKEFFPKGLSKRSPEGLVSFAKGDADVIAWAAAKFEETSRLLAALSHPNVVGIVDFRLLGEAGYAIMELVDGPSLEQWLRARGGSIGPMEARPIFAAITKALDYVHGHGIIHRDVAPDNVVMRGGVTPVLIDFGAASRSFAMRNGGWTRGIVKMHYTAPEQASATARPVAQTDVYALGAVLFRMLSGSPPPDAMDRIACGPGRDTLTASIKAMNVPASVGRVLTEALAIQQDARPSSAGAFERRLGWDEETWSRTQVQSEKREGRRKRRRMGLYAAAGAAAGAVLWMTPSDVLRPWIDNVFTGTGTATGRGDGQTGRVAAIDDERETNLQEVSGGAGTGTEVALATPVDTGIVADSDSVAGPRRDPIPGRRASARQTACDRFAAIPGHPDAAADGVRFNDIDATRAISVCRRSLAVNPGERRFVVQLARALEAGGRDDEAAEYYTRAAEAGDVYAMTSLAAMRSEGRGGPQDIGEAQRLYDLASRAMHPPAMLALATLHEGTGRRRLNNAEATWLVVRALELDEDIDKLGPRLRREILDLMRENRIFGWPSGVRITPEVQAVLNRMAERHAAEKH